MKYGTAIIIGAGPTGLTAAIELQRNSAIKPILIEAGQEIGGISRTIRYKGNRGTHFRQIADSKACPFMCVGPAPRYENLDMGHPIVVVH